MRYPARRHSQQSLADGGRRARNSLWDNLTSIPVWVGWVELTLVVYSCPLCVYVCMCMCVCVRGKPTLLSFATEAKVEYSILKTLLWSVQMLIGQDSIAIFKEDNIYTTKLTLQEGEKKAATLALNLKTYINLKKSFYIEGPIPTLGRGMSHFSRLLSLHSWLQSQSPWHGLFYRSFLSFLRTSQVFCSGWTAPNLLWLANVNSKHSQYSLSFSTRMTVH